MANDDNGLTPDLPGQSEAGPDPNLAPEAAPTQVVRRSEERQLPYPPVDPRRVLWRDSAMILVFVVIAVLGIQTFLPGTNGLPTDSSIPSPITLRSLAPGVTLAPGETLGPIIDPSLGLDATPTPIPVITLGPPTPSPSPSGSPKPSVKPSVKPSTGPSVPPSAPPSLPPSVPPPPTDTPPPPPTAAFNCTPAIGNQLSCTDSSTGNISSWTWAWGDGNQDTGPTPPTHTYAITFTTVTVTLTVSGPGGEDSLPQIFLLIP